MSEEKPTTNEPASTRPRWLRWIIPIVSLAVLVALGIILKDRLHDDVWAYYTDEQGIRADATEKKQRMVLWEDPKQRVFDAKKDVNASDPANIAFDRIEAAFSSDGTMMVLTRWAKDLEQPGETGADLYLSTWNGRVWSRPAPMGALNTAANERGAAFSRDGQHLYFSSDREGGTGGYDLYAAQFDGTNWTDVVPLGDTINSPKNESGPAASAEDSRLYFSSDRVSGSETKDIYVAERLAADENATAPVFTKAKPVSVLNSAADDIETALTGRGDHVFLASNRNKEGDEGFNLYLSRVVNGKMQPPQLVDVYIKRGNATDPAVRMEGFDLLFSADGDLTGAGAATGEEPKYRLYQSTTREVIGYTDLSEWEMFKTLMSRIIWWILLAIAALIALIYLLEKWRDITNLYHKCLAASAMVHLVLLLLLSYWLISKALDGGERQAPELAIPVDDMPEVDLALQSEPEPVQMTKSTQLVMDKNVHTFREMENNPAEAVTEPLPAPRRTTDQSLVTNFQPSKANQSESTAAKSATVAQNESSVLKDLAPTELPGLEVNELETGEAANAEPVEQVHPTRDDFKLDPKSLQTVKTEKATVDPMKNPKVEVEGKSEAVAPSAKAQPATDTVDPINGLEANALPRPMKSTTANNALTSNLPGENPEDSLAEGLELEVNPSDPNEGNFQRNDGDIRQVKTTKGNPGSASNDKADVPSDAKSVTGHSKPAPTTDTGGNTINPIDGLEAKSQAPKLDGFDKQPMFARNLPGEDPLDTLPDGVKLELPKDSPNNNNLGQYVKKLRGKPSIEVIEQLGGSDATERAIGLGLEWFTRNQEPDGRWEMSKHDSNSRYNTAGAGLALLCYYGWGIKHKDNSAHARAQAKAIDWLIKQQKPDGDLRGKQGGRMYCHGIAAIALCEAYGLTKDPKLKAPAELAIKFILNAQHEAGGWRYEPKQAGDLSVTGWQYMALHSARMADLPVPEEAFVKTRKYLDTVAGGRIGGRYGYMGKGNGPPAMTATGMFLRQLDLAPPDNPAQVESAAYLKANMLKPGGVRQYYDYYATLSLYQHQGPIWKEWNENLKKIYVATQKQNGAQKGSWDPQSPHVATGGRVLSTGLSVLSLEVYYRLLPMYGFGREEK